MIEDKLTRQIIQCAYEVHNTLGNGFLEKVYEKALLVELKNCGLKTAAQFPISVFYKGLNVGEYFADIVVENQVVIAIKAVQNLSIEHEVQLVNYLTATKMEIGLLINFGNSVEVKRKFRLYKKRDKTD